MNFVSKSERDEKEKRLKAMRDFEESQRRLFRRGKRIVLSFIVVHTILIIISCIYNPDNILAFIVDVVLMAGLLFGHKWIRYLYAVFIGIEAFVMAVTLIVNYNLIFSQNVMEDLLMIITCIVLSVFSVLLFTSNSITEYLYVSKNG